MPLSDEHRRALDAATVNIDQIQGHRRRWTISAAALFWDQCRSWFSGVVAAESRSAPVIRTSPGR